MSTADGPIWVMGILQVLVNGTMLFIVGSWIKSKDEKIGNLQKTVEEHHERRLKTLEHEQQHAKDSRGVLYSSKVDKAQCAKEHDKFAKAEVDFRNAVLMLERVSIKTESAMDDIDRILSVQAEQAKQLAAVSERMKDLKNG